MSATRLSRDALVAACEALAEKLDNMGNLLKIGDEGIEAFRAQLEAANKLVREQGDEIARLKSDLSKRQNARIIRNRSWTIGDRLSISCDGTLARINVAGRVLYSVDANTTGWEEVDAP